MLPPLKIIIRHCSTPIQHQRHVREEVPPLSAATTQHTLPPLSVAIIPPTVCFLLTIQHSLHTTQRLIQHKGSAPFHFHFPFSVSETYSPMRASSAELFIACA